MSKKSKYIMTAIAAVFLIAAVILTLKVRNNAPAESGLIINSGTETFTFPWEDLSQTSFSGETVNGKGEVSNHEYQGTELSELFAGCKITISADTKITVTSEDNYSVELRGEEVLTASKVYAAVISDNEMIRSIDGKQGGQLVVYGDPNAKRQVRYLKTITVENPAGN